MQRTAHSGNGDRHWAPPLNRGVGQTWRERTATWFATGALIGVVATLPLAAICALLFRFPVPFAGYMSGPGAVIPALMGALFYGIALGGFAVQALLGGLGGLAGARRGWPDKKRMRKLCVTCSLVGSAIGVMTMAVLDWIIGPW